MKGTVIMRLYAVLLLFSCLWVIIGAPLFAAEWQDIPSRLQQMCRQLPGRAGNILAQWH